MNIIQIVGIFRKGARASDSECILCPNLSTVDH